MGRVVAPIDMLRKCRGHFSKEAEGYRAAAIKAGTVWERNAAVEFGSTAEKFVSEIDATLRNWG